MWMKNISRQTVGRVLLIILALCMIALGVLRQENATVLQKAVHICLECIGVG